MYLVPKCKWYLIFVNVVCQFCLSQFVESDNDQGDENVDKKEWENDEVDDVENGHLSPKPGQGTLVLVRRRHRVLEDTEKDKRMKVIG